MLGFVAYGLSIFTYIRAQKYLGAAKTSAYYSLAPFIGTFLAFILLKESISIKYISALVVMIIGTVFIVYDTLIKEHLHGHRHTFTHTHDGITHTHTIAHSHLHNHFISDSKHGHHHSIEELENELKNEIGK